MKVLFSLKGISNYFLAPYYLSGLIFTHFPLWPSRQICLRGFVLSGMPFSWTAARRAPLLLSDLCSNATFISSCAAAAPRYSVSLPSCVFPYSTVLITTCQTAHLTFLDPGYFTSCVVARMEHRGHSRYWGYYLH